MIKAIFLDFEGVITNTPMLLHKNLFNRIKNEISYENFDARYKLAKTGKMNYAEFIKGFEKHKKFLLTLIGFRKGARKVLNYFNLKEVPIFLASNHIEGLAEKEVEILNLKKYFKKMFFSYKLGLAKPDEKFFEEIIKQSGLNLKKGEMIFVDDAKRNLLIAKKFGFITVYANNGMSEDRRNLIDFKPDYDINNLSELIPIFEELNKNCP